MQMPKAKMVFQEESMANEKNDNHTVLNTDIQGEVKIADDVVAAIAAIAAEEVEDRRRYRQDSYGLCGC